jgi:hypothetical protein
MLKSLDERDAHLLLEACLDAQERCDQRIREARDAGDTQAALAAIQQKERYESLTRRIVAEIQGDRDSLLEDSHVFSERVRRLLGSGK